MSRSTFNQQVTSPVPPTLPSLNSLMTITKMLSILKESLLHVPLLCVPTPYESDKVYVKSVPIKSARLVQKLQIAIVSENVIGALNFWKTEETNLMLVNYLHLLISFLPSASYFTKQVSHLPMECQR